jgi:hypothetical protein
MVRQVAETVLRTRAGYPSNWGQMADSCRHLRTSRHHFSFRLQRGNSRRAAGSRGGVYINKSRLFGEIWLGQSTSEGWAAGYLMRRQKENDLG